MSDRVLIAGGGIGGLALGLTLHGLGVDCLVLEAVRAPRPLGVGINLQPNAVRELMDLGFTEADLGALGLPIEEWALLGRNGREIHAEPRGRAAGYGWPQYAVHRGVLHMALMHEFEKRAGEGALRLGARVTGYEIAPGGAGVAALVETSEGGRERISGRLLVGADGIHSAVRAQMHPSQPPVHWGGALMWRGTSPGRPLRGGASFVGLGGSRQRLVIYPISPADPATGLATINWIAEVTVDDPEAQPPKGWFREAALSEVLPHFADWRYDWLDVPGMLRAAGTIWENPMIDRDPVPTWVEGPVALLGDAAHAMYPTGSNGASQAVIDARVLGRCLLDHGITPAALAAYDGRLCAPVSELVLRNREAGPFGLLDIVDARCGGHFEDIDRVVPPREREAFMAAYKSAAGFARETLNAAAPTLPPGARVEG